MTTVSGDEPYSKGAAFFLWLACIFGFCGVHRFYLGRPVTGLLWFFTFGLLGVGQLIDLVRLSGMVTSENERHAQLHGRTYVAALPPARAAAPVVPQKPEEIEVALTRAAAKKGGSLTVPQAVMATGRTYEDVESALDDMLKAGHIGIDNDEETGAVIYTFSGLG